MDVRVDTMSGPLAMGGCPRGQRVWGSVRGLWSRSPLEPSSHLRVAPFGSSHVAGAACWVCKPKPEPVGVRVVLRFVADGCSHHAVFPPPHAVLSVLLGSLVVCRFSPRWLLLLDII